MLHNTAYPTIAGSRRAVTNDCSDASANTRGGALVMPFDDEH